MEALTEQMQKLMGALQDVKVQQSIYESKSQESQLDSDFTFSKDEATTESQQLAQLTAMKNSIINIESKKNFQTEKFVRRSRLKIRQSRAICQVKLPNLTWKWH